nr:MAG TPA: hypothetical protein [Caudoviricetes sp.]
MNDIYDTIILLILFIIIYLSVISIYKFYISMKYYNELDEYRKRRLLDDHRTVMENKHINHDLSNKG